MNSAKITKKKAAESRSYTIEKYIEMAVSDCTMSVTIPFNLNAKEISELSKLGYGVEGSTISWEA